MPPKRLPKKAGNAPTTRQTRQTRRKKLTLGRYNYKVLRQLFPRQKMQLATKSVCYMDSLIDACFTKIVNKALEDILESKRPMLTDDDLRAATEWVLGDLAETAIEKGDEAVEKYYYSPGNN
jgi:hypothetical protein